MAKVIEPINGIIRPDLRTEDVVKAKVNELCDMVNVLAAAVEVLLVEVEEAYGLDVEMDKEGLRRGKRPC